MAKTRQQKEDNVNDLTTRLRAAKAVVFANFQGLKVSESEELRAKCREQKVDYLATKKTLLKRALGAAGMEQETKDFAGGVAVVFGHEDEVAPARIIDKFAQSHEVVAVYGGILEGRLIDAAKVRELAKLPTKTGLYAKLVGSLNAPISGFVNVLSGNLRGLVNVFNNLKQAKS